MSRLGGPADDIQKCVAGRCIGAHCPCLCHTSLKVAHDQLRADNARKKQSPSR